MVSVAIVSRDHNESLRRMLGKAGYETVVAADVERLLAMHAERPVDVVLLHPAQFTDTTMPDLVREVARGLGDESTAILPMLQRGNLADRVRSLWYGAANVVNLPLRNDELLTGIASVLRRSRPHRPSPTVSAAV